MRPHARIQTLIMKKVNIGFIGCGNISNTYFPVSKKFDILNSAACADIDMPRAQEQAAKYGMRAMSVDELLADPSIEIVVNLTVPQSHAEIALRALQADKHIYNEKPLAIERADAQKMLALAREKNLRVGGAPDTFLGAGLQTCRKIIDDGVIGDIVGATAWMLSAGPDNWHPNPSFFYHHGGGPMFDMGPYYLTALVSMLGGIRRVSGATRITQKVRTPSAGPAQGQTLHVEVPTHISAVLEFAAGPIATLTTSFDTHTSEHYRLEIFGTRGTLQCNDPNVFGGEIRLMKAGSKEWQPVSYTHAYAENSRSLGVADMAYAIRNGRKHRANDELTYHVLDVMHATHDAAREGKAILMSSSCERPAPLPISGLSE